MGNPTDTYRYPGKYTGPDYSFAPRYLRPRDPRSPTDASPDIKPKEQQGYYPTGSFWTNTANGNLWVLAKITNNLAKWILLTGGEGPIVGVVVDASTPPGTNPVVPTVAGLITITGGQVATGTIGANVIRTDSLAANTFTIEIQRSTAVAASDSTKNGVSHFNSAQFTVDSNAFVSTLGNTVHWNIISVNTQLVINNGYICVSPGGNLQLTLPATATLGDLIEITLDGATSWTIIQTNAAHQIRYNNLQTTLGATGTLATTDTGNTIRMVAQTATRWNVLSALGTLIVS